MTLALLIAIAGVVAVAGGWQLRGRRQHPGDRWVAEVTTRHQERAHMAQAISSSTNGRRPL